MHFHDNPLDLAVSHPELITSEINLSLYHLRILSGFSSTNIETSVLQPSHRPIYLIHINLLSLLFFPIKFRFHVLTLQPSVVSYLQFSRFVAPDSHCLLASILSDEKSAMNLIKVPLYIISHFLLAVFQFLSFSFNTLIMICLGVYLWVYPTWNLLRFLDV